MNGHAHWFEILTVRVWHGAFELLQGPGHMMVMNVGNRPTFVDGDGLSVEAHVMHDYGRDFHGACGPQAIRGMGGLRVASERKRGAEKGGRRVIHISGERMRVVVLGYVRPEMRFDGLQALLQRIYTDMALARSCLGHPMLRCYQSDDFLADF